jgi:hypothetical protein
MRHKRRPPAREERAEPSPIQVLPGRIEMYRGRQRGVDNRESLTGGRGFESVSLQQTVRLSWDFYFLYRKAGSCRGVRGLSCDCGRLRLCRKHWPRGLLQEGRTGQFAALVFRYRPQCRNPDHGAGEGPRVVAECDAVPCAVNPDAVAEAEEEPDAAPWEDAA